MTALPASYDAILIVSFGGPEGPDDVIPFLENVLRGKNVPRERMLEVAEHYQHFGGVSPINAQNRALIAALETELKQHGPALPIYWGNRNWAPYLTDTVRQMADAGVKRAVAYFTSAFSSYSGCRQYRENVFAAQAAVGERAPQIDKLRVFYNHPGFILPMIERVQSALDTIPAERRDATHLVFTAHSIPMSMASGCNYVTQLDEACRLVSNAFPQLANRLVYQSRSGPPTQPWLEPDVGDYLRGLAGHGVKDVVVIPIGFISDHMEVMYDLDYEAKHIAEGLGMNVVRAGTVGTHPQFVSMIRELIAERMGLVSQKRFLGTLGPSHDVCPLDCCPAPQRPAGPPPR
ncbi:MAG: ferrochelatase [Planctomycetaceae bacterium]|nr:ferrochelatase [Planctomycetaceae bacterium]